MTKVYEYPRVVDGEMKKEFVILSSNFNRDFLQVVHDVAVDYCLKNENRRPCKGDGMSFGQIMGCITPEMLEPYGVTMLRLDDMAVQTDQMPPLVTRYELETIRAVRRLERRHAREVVDFAERAARRLETQRARKNPGVSNWGPEQVAVKAASWASQYVMLEGKKDFARFFNQKLRETLPKGPDEGPTDEETT